MKHRVRVLVGFLLALACFSSCNLLPNNSSSMSGNSDSSESASSLLDASVETNSSEEEKAEVYEIFDAQDIPYYLSLRSKKVVMEVMTDIVFQAPYAIASDVVCDYTEELIINGNGYSMTFLEEEGVYQAISLTKPNAKMVINDLTIVNQKMISTSGDRKIIYTSINATTVEYNDCVFDGPVRFMNNATCKNCVFDNENDRSTLDRYIIFFEPNDGNSYTMTLDGCTLSCPEGTYGLVKVYDQVNAGLYVRVKNTTFAENAAWMDLNVGGDVHITLEGTNVFSDNGEKVLKASNDGVTVNGVVIENGVLYTADALAELLG